MGLKYDSSESSIIIKAMKNNLAISSEAISGLQSGTHHLINTLKSGSLGGVAYNAAEGLFSELFLPIESRVTSALDDVKLDLTVYSFFSSTVKRHGILDEDNLKEQILEAKKQRFHTNTLLNMYRASMYSPKFMGMTTIIDFLTDTCGKLEKYSNSLDNKIEKLYRKLQSLYDFSDKTSPLFKDSLGVLSRALESAEALNNLRLKADGTLPVDFNKILFYSKFMGISFSSAPGELEKRKGQYTEGFLIPSSKDLWGKLFGRSDITFEVETEADYGSGWTKSTIKTRKEGTGILNFDYNNAMFAGFSINLGSLDASFDFLGGNFVLETGFSGSNFSTASAISFSPNSLGLSMGVGTDKVTNSVDLGIKRTFDWTNGLSSVYMGKTTTVSEGDLSVSTRLEKGKKFLNGKQVVAVVAVTAVVVASVFLAPVVVPVAGTFISTIGGTLVTLFQALSTST